MMNRITIEGRVTRIVVRSYSRSLTLRSLLRLKRCWGIAPRPAQRLPTNQCTAEREERFVNVGPLVVADTEASKLIEPGKCPLDDPAPSSQTAAVLGTAHRQQRQDAASSQPGSDGLCLVAAVSDHRDLGDAAAVPARPGVAESHPPAPVPPASRFGWRRSGEPRAARPARRRSDDACSRAWPDQWDLDRSGHRRRPRGRNNSPRPPANGNLSESEARNPFKLMCAFWRPQIVILLRMWTKAISDETSTIA